MSPKFYGTKMAMNTGRHVIYNWLRKSILHESGYSSVVEFAEAEYNLDKTKVSRFIRINDKFAEGGYSDRLQENYRGFGYAKLTLMLNMPAALNEELTPDYSKSEIQQLKDQVDEESKTSDLEILLEGQDPAMAAEEDDLSRAVRQLAEDIQEGETIPRLYKEIWTEGRTFLAVEDLQEIMAPAGQRMYSMRIRGMGGRNLSLKDHNNGDSVALINIRTGEKQNYTWERLMEVWRQLISGGETYQEAWQQLYGREWPEEKEATEENPEVAPVQPKEEKKTAPRKESKVSQPKKQELARETEKPVKSVEEPKPEEMRQQPIGSQNKWPSNYKPGDVVMNTLSSECGELVEQTAKDKIWLFRPTAPAGDPYNLSENYFKTETQVTDSCSGEAEPGNHDTDTVGTEEQVPGQTELQRDFPQYCPDETSGQKSAYLKSIRGAVDNLVRYAEMDLIGAARLQVKDISGYLDKLEELSKGGGQDAEEIKTGESEGV